MDLRLVTAVLFLLAAHVLCDQGPPEGQALPHSAGRQVHNAAAASHFHATRLLYSAAHHSTTNHRASDDSCASDQYADNLSADNNSGAKQHPTCHYHARSNNHTSSHHPATDKHIAVNNSCSLHTAANHKCTSDHNSFSLHTAANHKCTSDLNCVAGNKCASDHQSGANEYSNCDYFPADKEPFDVPAHFASMLAEL